MSNTFVVILFGLIVFCNGSTEDQEPNANPEFSDKSEYGEDKSKYEAESKQDYDKMSEKEKEVRLIQKAKKVKEGSYRRALENILPARNTEGYRRFFEDLINDPDETFKSDAPQKGIEKVNVTDTFIDKDTTEKDTNDKDFEPQVEEIELVIERITDNSNHTSNGDKENFTEPDLAGSNLTENPFKVDLGDTSTVAAIKSVNESDNQQPSTSDTSDNFVINSKGRMAIDFPNSFEVNPVFAGHLPERRLLDPYSFRRISEVMVPHYRTTLSRGRMIVNPAVYTVTVASPVTDPVTARNRISSRVLGLNNFPRSGNVIRRSDSDVKLMDDYHDYDSNGYIFSPPKMYALDQHSESKSDVLAKLPPAPHQPSLAPLKPLVQRESPLYPGVYFPRVRRYYSDSYRPFLRIRR